MFVFIALYRTRSRSSGKAFDRIALFRQRKRDQFVKNILSVYFRNDAFQTVSLCKSVDLAVDHIFDGNIRVSEHKVVDDVRNVAFFPFCRFQKLISNGRIEKQRTDGDRRSHSQGTLPFLFDLAPLNDQIVGDIVVNKLAFDLHSTHFGNTRKRLPAKTKGSDCIQIFRRTNFTCCMRHNRKRQILFFNSAPIVNYGNGLDPSAFDHYGYIFRTCIDTVFHKFFYDGSGIFHDFPRSQPVINRFIELIDFSHAFSLFDHFFQISQNSQRFNGRTSVDVRIIQYFFDPCIIFVFREQRNLIADHGRFVGARTHFFFQITA